MATITLEVLADSIELTWKIANHKDNLHAWRKVMAELDGIQMLMVSAHVSKHVVDASQLLWCIALERASMV